MPKCDTVCVKNAARSGVLDDLSHRYAGQPNLLSNVHMKWSVLFLFDHGGSYCTEEKKPRRAHVPSPPLSGNDVTRNYRISICPSVPCTVFWSSFSTFLCFTHVCTCLWCHRKFRCFFVHCGPFYVLVCCNELRHSTTLTCIPREVLTTHINWPTSHVAH